MRQISLVMGCMGFFLLAACGGATGGTETGNATPQAIGYAVGDSIDTVGGFVSDPGAEPLAFRPPAPTYWQLAAGFILGSPAYAAACSVTGSLRSP